MDIDTNTDGKDGDTTSNSVEDINGYNVFTDEYYDNVEKVTLLEYNKEFPKLEGDMHLYRVEDNQLIDFDKNYEEQEIF